MEHPKFEGHVTPNRTYDHSSNSWFSWTMSADPSFTLVQHMMTRTSVKYAINVEPGSADPRFHRLEVDRISASVSAPNVDKWALSARTFGFGRKQSYHIRRSFGFGGLIRLLWLLPKIGHRAWATEAWVSQTISLTVYCPCKDNRGSRMRCLCMDVY